MPALPHNGYIGFVKETTWATDPGSGFDYIPALSEGLKVEIASKIIKGLNNSRTPTRRVQLARMCGGQVAWEVDAEDVVGLFLKSLFGTETLTDDGAGNGGQHAFEPGTTFPSLTARVCRDVGVAAGNIWALVGGKVKQLTFQAAVDEVLKGTVDLSFKDGTSGASGLTADYTTQNPLIYHTGTVTIDGSAVPIRSFSCTISGGAFAERKKIGSNLIQEQQPGLFAVSGELEFYYDDLTQVNKFLNGTAAAIVVDLTGALVGTTTRRLKFEIPTAFYNGETPTMQSPEAEIMAKIPFEAVKTGSGSPDKLIRVTLNNSQRTAY